MSRAFVLNISFTLALSLVLAIAPQASFAQRGGFRGASGSFQGGGFGGFHNGGGWHGGRGFGGFHSGFGGFRGGNFGGFRHGPSFGGFGYPRYGWDFSFGVWSYWDPWFWGYSPWWGAPYPYFYPYDYYPDDRYYRRDDHDHCRPDYRHPENSCTDNSPFGQNRQNTPKPSSAPSDYRNQHSLASGGQEHELPDENPATTTPKVKVISSTRQESSGLRPAVKNAIQLLRAIPPAAREHYLNSALYESFSPEERELLNRESEPVQ